MRAILTLLTLAALASCHRWRIPDSDNKYLTVLKRDGNLVKTKARLASELRVDAAEPDTMTSRVTSGKATITTTTRKGVTMPPKTKGAIVEDEGTYYFVPKDRDLRRKAGRIPINVESHKIYIRTVKGRMVGTHFVVDTNDPGFELRIKEDEKTESIKATN